MYGWPSAPELAAYLQLLGQGYILANQIAA